MFGLSGLFTKVLAGLAAAGLFVIGILRIISGAKKAERQKIEGKSARKETEILKDARKERENVRRGGPDAARDRMRERRNKRNG